jgi:hypothetical protein
MSLLARQRELRDHILGVAGAPSGLSARAAPGLAVYHHAYRTQLVACVRDTYERTWAWLGDTAFDTAALRHVETHPPRSWTLADYAADFPGSLRRDYPSDPEVAELAWLDWALRRAFDGPDAEPIAAEALASVDWDAAVLQFAPTLTISEATTNCAAIWTALAEGETPPAVERLPRPGGLRVWRAGLSPQYRTVEAFELQALELALEGVNFGRLCEVMAEGEDSDHAAERLGGLLIAWLQDGLVSKVSS